MKSIDFDPIHCVYTSFIIDENMKQFEYNWRPLNSAMEIKNHNAYLHDNNLLGILNCWTLYISKHSVTMLS